MWQRNPWLAQFNNRLAQKILNYLMAQILQLVLKEPNSQRTYSHKVMWLMDLQDCKQW